MSSETVTNTPKEESDFLEFDYSLPFEFVITTNDKNLDEPPTKQPSTFNTKPEESISEEKKNIIPYIISYAYKTIPVSFKYPILFNPDDIPEPDDDIYKILKQNRDRVKHKSTNIICSKLIHFHAKDPIITAKYIKLITNIENEITNSPLYKKTDFMFNNRILNIKTPSQEINAHIKYILEHEIIYKYQYIIKFDIKAAYYSIDTELMFDTILDKILTNKTHKKFIRDLYSSIDSVMEYSYLYVGLTTSRILFEAYMRYFLNMFYEIYEFNNIFNFVDDFIIYGDDLDNLEKKLSTIMETLKDYGLYLNPEKSVIINIFKEDLFMLGTVHSIQTDCLAGTEIYMRKRIRKDKVSFEFLTMTMKYPLRQKYRKLLKNDIEEYEKEQNIKKKQDLKRRNFNPYIPSLNDLDVSPTIEKAKHMTAMLTNDLPEVSSDVTDFAPTSNDVVHADLQNKIKKTKFEQDPVRKFNIAYKKIKHEQTKALIKHTTVTVVNKCLDHISGISKDESIRKFKLNPMSNYFDF